MTAFARFDRIRIINLRERIDRRREMERELAAVGLANDARVSFFPAIRPPSAGPFTSIGARGVYESQLAILRDAAASGVSVLILEDDCSFVDQARKRDIGEDWDIFYGGYYAADPHDLRNSDIVGAHMMGFTAHGARLVCDYLNDLQFDGIHPPIDAAYVWFRRANPDVRTSFATPPLAVQRFSRSDITANRFYDRLPGLRQLAGFARKFKEPFRS